VHSLYTVSSESLEVADEIGRILVRLSIRETPASRSGNTSLNENETAQASAGSTTSIVKLLLLAAADYVGLLLHGALD